MGKQHSQLEHSGLHFPCFLCTLGRRETHKCCLLSTAVSCANFLGANGHWEGSSSVSVPKRGPREMGPSGPLLF